MTSLLRLFSDVRDGEARSVLTLLGNLFLIMVAYYIIKTVREPLILASGGAELKTYASAAQAGTLIVLVPLYSRLSSRVARMRLIWGVTLFFVACIEVFYVLAYLSVPFLGFVFYVWVGIFSLAVIAQFWSYANDVYDKDEGERLFPVVAIGATAGSVVGAKAASLLFDAGVGAYEMLQISAVILLIHGGVYTWLDARVERSAAQDKALEQGDGFGLVVRSPYLRLIAALLILLNVVNTTGEYILSSLVTDAARAAAAADPSVDIGAYIGSFYGDYFFWVNLLTVTVQALLVSRIVKYAGMAGVLFLLPIVAFGAYGLVAAGIGLSVVRWAKSAENTTDYSVMNTARALMWLPTSREEKYKAKQAIDTFFVRMGDMVAAGIVFVGTSMLDLTIPQFALVNLVVIVVWLGLAYLVWQRYEALAAAMPEAEPA